MKRRLLQASGIRSGVSTIDGWLLPLIILAFTGLTITLLQGVIAPWARWLGVLLALGVALVRGNILAFLSHPTGWWIGAFQIWALLSCLWSEDPRLSFMKAVAFGLVAFGCGAIGFSWSSGQKLSRIMNCFYPLLALVVIAGVFGIGQESTTIRVGTTAMYQGLVGHPNMFGSMCALCTPLLAWKLYCKRGQREWSYWLALTGIVLTMLYLSSSRAAVLIALFAMGGFFVVLPGRGKWNMFGVGVVAILVSTTLFGNLSGNLRGFIYKWEEAEDERLFLTRENPWRESKEAAIEGGWTGLGYGVTWGQAGFEGTWHAIGYSREKGSTLYALREETGYVGMGIYCGLMSSLLVSLGAGIKRRLNNDIRVFSGIVFGAIIGFFMNNLFEAWWVAPGSPESGIFWIIVGIGMGRSHLKPVPYLSRKRRVIHTYVRE